MKDFFKTMKLRTTLKRVYLPTLLGTILLSVAFRTAAIFANFNTETGFFDEKILINFASWIVICGSVFMFTYAFTGSKKNKLIADFSTPATYVPTGALSVAMIFFAVATAIKSSKTDFSIRQFMALPGVTPADLTEYISKNMANLVLSIMAPMACLAIGYFILTACVLRRSSSIRAFLGTMNVLFLAFYTSYLYFDSTSTLARNAPNKIVDQMAFLFAALFFLYEIRISLGREKWNLYIAFGFVASALTAYSSIPSLAFYFIDGSAVSNSPEENVLCFALFVFITSRLTLAAFLKEDKESESVIAMKEFARGRTAYLKEKEEAARRAYAELYKDLSEISADETAEDVVQITFNDSIELLEGSSAEYVERELILPDYNESDDEGTADSEAEFIQESILFPKEETDVIYTAENDIAYTEETETYETTEANSEAAALTNDTENGAAATNEAEIPETENTEPEEDSDGERTI